MVALKAHGDKRLCNQDAMENESGCTLSSLSNIPHFLDICINTSLKKAQLSLAECFITVNSESLYNRIARVCIIEEPTTAK